MCSVPGAGASTTTATTKPSLVPVAAQERPPFAIVAALPVGVPSAASGCAWNVPVGNPPEEKPSTQVSSSAPDGPAVSTGTIASLPTPDGACVPVTFPDASSATMAWSPAPPATDTSHPALDGASDTHIASAGPKHDVSESTWKSGAKRVKCVRGLAGGVGCTASTHATSISVAVAATAIDAGGTPSGACVQAVVRAPAAQLSHASSSSRQREVHESVPPAKPSAVQLRVPRSAPSHASLDACPLGAVHGSIFPLPQSDAAHRLFDGGGGAGMPLHAVREPCAWPASPTGASTPPSAVPSGLASAPASVPASGCPPELVSGPASVPPSGDGLVWDAVLPPHAAAASTQGSESATARPARKKDKCITLHSTRAPLVFLRIRRPPRGEPT